MKIFITFGASQLRELGCRINPMLVMLVVSGEDEFDARRKVMESFIGRDFCTSYIYNEYAAEFKEKHGAKEYTLEELEALKEEQT